MSILPTYEPLGWEDIPREIIEADVMVFVKRRELVGKQKLCCPRCDTNQVQLVSWTNPVVDLKCRCCKYTFKWDAKT